MVDTSDTSNSSSSAKPNETIELSNLSKPEPSIASPPTDNVKEISAKSTTEESKVEKKETIGSVPFFQLYRFAGPVELFFLAVGTLGALLNGVSLPVMSIILGDMIQTFGTFDYIIGLKNVNPYFPQAVYAEAERNFKDSLWTSVYHFFILASVTFVAAYLQLSLYQWTAESQITRIKEEYLKSLLRQEVAYFDTQKSGALTSRIASDTQQIKDGISDKVGATIQSFATFISGFVVAFTKGPILTAILLIVLPFIVGSAAFTGKLTAKFASNALQAYSAAGAFAEEIFAAFRTVVSFSGEKRAGRKYEDKLKDAMKQEGKKGYISGVGVGCVFFFIFSMYALGFWAGAKLLINETITVGQIVNVFLSFLIASFALGQAAPNITYFATARVAAYKIFEVIDRNSLVNPFDEEGKKIPDLRGHIHFKNVDFAYPTRLDVPILKNFNMEVLPGQTVALVGQSGSGKSTCVGLTERFYLPLSGVITLDGVPLSELNVSWLRSRIGYVGQEPVLFSGTIRDNIAWGAFTSITDEDILNALKNANAYDFVMQLPKKLDTLIGERGANLSGGQKQRIAIARALIRNPPIIIFDEATSALDTQSEKIVQEALNKAAEGRTSIVIAHRLSTVKNADLIIVMKKGVVMETGKHDELIQRQGYYYQLVHDQQVELEEEKKEENEGDEDDESDDQKGSEQPTAEATGETQLSTSQLPPKDLNHASSTSMDKRSSVASNASIAKKKNVTIDDEVSLEPSPFIRAIKNNASQWKWIVVGLISAVIAGSVTPAYALIYSQAITSYSNAYKTVNNVKMPDSDEMNRLGSLWGGIFLGIALIAGLANYLQVTSFIVSGEVLVSKMRLTLFQTILRQEVSFFDRDENAVGILASKLSSKTSLFRNLVGDTMGTIVQVSMSITIGALIALVTAWQLALVVLAFAPFIMLSGVVQGRLLYGIGDKNIENKASKLATEVVSNVKTVASLGLEKKFIQDYHQLLKGPRKLGLKEAFLGAMVFGLSSCIVYITYGVGFIYAGNLLIWGTYRFEQVFRAIATIVFSALLGGRIAQFLPDYAKARQAAIEVFQILDRTSCIDVNNQPTTNFPEPKGAITFDQVHFRYPSRKEVRVHRGLTFSVPAGKKVALVGSSGSGKSTVIQLMERFYDPEKGKILIDNLNIADMNVNELRGCMALVGQEPCLFDGTIFENIKYGALDATNVTEVQVHEAAKLANVHEFILSLPLGYNTPVGEKGGMLSGGQKQRVAIARAMIRNPKILLLDEATSALDAESEVQVQHALDAASVGRTTLIIAHRLSTVQNADLIFVVHRGKIVESGNHKTLIAKRGYYFKLVETQMEVKKAS